MSSGYFASVLVRAGLRVDGHELDPAVAERARQVCENVYVGDLSTFDPDELDGTYEVLLFGDTLEHLPDPPAVLRRLRTRLSPGGALIISVPNVANWLVRLQLLVGRFNYTDRGIMDRTHLRFYTVRTVTEMLVDAGFRVESLVGSIPVPGVTDERLGPPDPSPRQPATVAGGLRPHRHRPPRLRGSPGPAPAGATRRTGRRRRRRRAPPPPSDCRRRSPLGTGEEPPAVRRGERYGRPSEVPTMPWGTVRRRFSRRRARSAPGSSRRKPA